MTVVDLRDELKKGNAKRISAAVRALALLLHVPSQHEGLRVPTDSGQSRQPQRDEHLFVCHIRNV